MTFLENAWYMAAWSDEIETDKPLARTLLGIPVVFYRSEGAVHALVDRCPHRFVPLSLGNVANGRVTCIYHGLAFDGTGACVANPHGPITKSLAVRRFPVVEAHRAIWIWMGDAQKADPSAIRDLRFLSEAPETAFNKGYLRGQGHYQLFVDNILDLSHTDFLHPDTLGGGSITRTPALVEQREDGSVLIAWRPKNEVPIPLVAARFPPGTRVDSWTEVEWSAPGILKLISGAVPTGTPRANGDNSINVHVLTPETEASTHYFFASTRDFNLEDADYNELTRKTRERIFSIEDEPIIAAQQDRIGSNDFWHMKPALLSIDKGAVIVRRKMDDLIAKEKEEAQ